MDSAAEAQWATLHPYLIDAIAALLKRSGSWEADGPSLRTLNEHWCQCISNHFTVLRPHFTRQLVAQDAKSFVKFPRVTTVDISQFFHRRITEAEGQTILEGLASMEGLSRLEIGFSESVIPFFSQAGLAMLSSVTSLRIMGASLLGLPAEAFMRLGRIPLQKFTTDTDIPNLEGFLESVPTLKRLEMGRCDGSLFTETLISKLQALDSISIKHVSMGISQLLHVSCLEHVGTRVYSGDMEIVSELTQLVSLSLTVDLQTSRLFTLDCLSGLSKLTTLQICGLHFECCNCEWRAPLPQLKRLMLRDCIVRGSQLGNYLPQLTAFRGYKCEIQEVDAFREWRKCIECFSAEQLRGPDRRPLWL